MHLFKNPLLCYVCSSSELCLPTHPSFLMYDEKYFLPVSFIYHGAYSQQINTVSLHDKQNRAQILESMLRTVEDLRPRAYSTSFGQRTFGSHMSFRSGAWCSIQRASQPVVRFLPLISNLQMKYSLIGVVCRCFCSKTWVGCSRFSHFNETSVKPS